MRLNKFIKSIKPLAYFPGILYFLQAASRGFSGLKVIFLLVMLFTSAPNVFAQEYYFYTKKPYGSEALFNPLTMMINGGYDVCQLQSVSTKIGEHQYHRMFDNVWLNLSHPLESIRIYGWQKFLKTEFFPLGFKTDEMQWIPNYQQHLIGGGMLFTAMKEWYEQHNFPAPWLFSSVTLMTHHLLNEVLETGPYEGWSVDEVSDIYVFDLGGIILFSFDSVNKFFHDELNLSDWSLQASVTFPEGRVNAGQYFSMKWKLPFSDNYSLFYRYGMGALFGFSKKLDESDNLSVGLGFRTKHLVDLSSELRERTIETGWHAGAFYDRNNSLMASVVFSGVKEYFCMVDIYPGIIKFNNFSPGIWSVVGRDGKLSVGFSTQYVFGSGFSNY